MLNTQFAITDICVNYFYAFLFKHLALCVFLYSHLFTLGSVIFPVDFISGLDAHSYYQDHVELKPVNL